MDSGVGVGVAVGLASVVGAGSGSSEGITSGVIVVGEAGSEQAIPTEKENMAKVAINSPPWLEKML